jgi:hypothetical protein
VINQIFGTRINSTSYLKKLLRNSGQELGKKLKATKGIVEVSS